MKKIFAIESSCDETACAIINENLDIEVKTKQEKDIVFPIVDIVKVDKNKLNIECFYKNMWEV